MDTATVSPCLLRALSCALLFALAWPTSAQERVMGERATHLAARTPDPPRIDGHLDDDVWDLVPAIDTFVQREPTEGGTPSESTLVRVLYDDDALYVAARMYDSAPDSIVARLGRRDADLEADLFAVMLDPYLDRRSGFYFGINAAGTRYDGVLYNDDWDDDSWDGVWEARAQIDGEGWTAEMRIPYSQLRFYKQPRYTWGLNIRRDISRKNEQIMLVHVPRTESGFVSRFHNLVGIESIRPRRQIEVTPYVTTRAEFTPSESGDPFNDGSRYTPGAGADLKVGLTSNLTLNATINPDFGQVEVDPAVVNLSDIEVFFPERRPFFIEGAQTFNFGYGGASDNWGFNWGNPDFFYSRRIGRAPQGSAPDADYVDRPDGTNILGAAKVTGKAGGGWNVGTVHAVTAREHARLETGDDIHRAEIEPPTYYGVARAQREMNDGRQGLGFIGTATVRQFGEDRLESEFNSDAYTGGIDGWTFLDKDKAWVLTGWGGVSHVRGSQDRILNLQRSSLHYFQRPDLDHVSVDSSATSLTGFAGRLAVNKERGNVAFNAAVGAISPSFDVNDLGFMWRADYINAHVMTGYRWTDPTTWYRRLYLFTSVFRSMDYSGNTVWAGVWGRTYVQFRNWFELGIGGAINPETTVDTRLTRGGPSALRPPGAEVFAFVETDDRKDVVAEVGGFTYQSEADKTTMLEVELEWKPAANVAVALNPSVRFNKELAQWVGAYDDAAATATFGRRYLFAELDQVTLSSSVRLNWTFTPRLSFQLYAQPLISAGDYSSFKELARARSFDFVDPVAEGRVRFDADEDAYVATAAASNEETSFGNPDFNTKSLRGTAVMRWEYRPGSTLFLVWTQTRSHFAERGSFNFGQDLDDLFTERPDNIFMIKLTYWLGR